ncbi:eukaryotic translation initiation factor 3 subunit A-like [Mizuhopecten yessoensis]|uniref:Eukaryotic translation initiation factor 3 subunit A n=1 Tax=Mizuhopecten yessoensis TaxID=6573 RepID=A0A210Q354_MIZYE|nr:eukaryotic translation initiation factor 3 subunit A-like [Mizuhopecten yessoensis]OWF43183.1 Eukaryotic translation initiation factor 3 subunit A [Mizuhopecten yessoensis]
MPTYFQRPENALKRANEFIDVGKKQRALDALYDVIKSKKHRTWQKIHEPIMEKYLQLCVELRKSHIAKEGLYQYKNICQQVNIKSLEDVVRKYIRLAESKTEGARQESHQVVVDIDDLDIPDTPESLLLKAVSGEDTQDRTDRAILTPWVKFLWESYRQCLDLLRNNSRVERLYQDIAQQAFKFCLEYTRKTEFRKLCDNLRTHLGHIHKHQNQQTAINLNNPDSQAMHLETRLVQLDSAINMELWQEAFKAVEDIHGLICLSKKPPKPSLMANYYQKLGLVFWKSGNALFHASTLHRLFHLSREQRKNLSQEELQKMASKVLCATLAVPIPPSRNAIDQLLETNESTMEKQRRLATLLMLNSPPTRQGLIKDLVKYNIIQYVNPELQNLYNWLEVDFHPLCLYDRVKAPVEFIAGVDELNQYMNCLENILITRVLKQVSQVYQTIEFSRIAALVPFSSSFRLERVIVESARTLDLQVRIDHRKACLSFGTDLMVAQKEDVPEGPYIQSMPSEQIRNQLTSIAEALHKSVILIEPKERKVQREELRMQIINNYRMTYKKDHSRILQRRQIIESRKEELEHMNDQREREELEQAEEIRKKAYDAEMARLDREAKERERQRRVEEHKEIQKKHAMEKIEQLKKTEIGSKVLQNLDEEDFEKLDVDEIMQKQLEQLEKEKKELQERLKSQEKKIDFFARAKRVEEIPLLVEQYEKESKDARAFWERMEEERIERMKSEREIALETQVRLSRMVKDKDDFLNRLKDQRKEEFKKKLTEFDEKMKEERKRRIKERKEKRKEERKNKWREEKEEAEQKARDEALIREREEKEQEEMEKMEEERREYENRLAKLEELDNRRKAREREIEEKEMRRREEERSGQRRGDEISTDRPTWRPEGAREGGGWREREKQRTESWKKETSPVKQPEEERWGGNRESGRPEEGREGWRSREGRDEGEKDGWRGPRDDRESDGFRGPPKEDRGGFERGPRDSRDSYGDRGPKDDRDSFRGPPRDDRDGPRDRGPSRDEGRWSDRGPRDDQDGPGSWRGREDKGQREEGSGAWRGSRGGDSEGGRRWGSQGGESEGGRWGSRGGDSEGSSHWSRGGDSEGGRRGIDTESRWSRGGDSEGGSRWGSRGGDSEGGSRWGSRGGDSDSGRWGSRGGDYEGGNRGGDSEGGGRWSSRGGDFDSVRRGGDSDGGSRWRSGRAGMPRDVRLDDPIPENRPQRQESKPKAEETRQEGESRSWRENPSPEKAKPRGDGEKPDEGWTTVNYK